MQIVSSTLVALILCALMAVRGPYRGLVIFFGLMPMGAMAAFNLPAVGGATITASDLAILVLFGSLALRPQGLADMAGTLRPGQPGFWLMLLMAYATLATLFFPRVFEGQTDVFGIGRVANAIGIVIRPLRPDGGNLSQLFRMLLSALAFVTMATVFRRNPDMGAIHRAMIAATLVHVGLGVMDVATYSTGTSWLMEMFRTANYTLTINHEMSGVKRMIGGFPEASAFGYFTLGIFGFWLRYWLSSSNDRATGFYLLLSAAVLLRSTSSSAYVAGAGLLLVLMMQALLSGGMGTTVSRRIGWVTGVVLALLPVVVLSVMWAYETMPGVRAFLDRSLLNKMETDSGVERMSWNAQAFRNFLDTWMLGAGLGSVRASNWIIASLATLGAIGTGLIVAWVWAVLRVRAVRDTPEVTVMIRALQVGCLGLLIRALVVKASPNLDVLFFAMAGAAVGLARAKVTVSATNLAELPVFRAMRPQRAM